MANRMYMDQLLRLTLVRKGATAKHPLLRKDVVEAVKATESDEHAEYESQEGQEGQEGSETGEIDWYEAFEAYITSTDPSDRAGSWEEGFAAVYAEKAAKRPNYPASRGPFAGPHNSFPIASQHDVYSAARLIGHAQNPAAVKQRIIAIARSKGYTLPKSWQSKSKVSKSVNPLELAQQLVAALAPTSSDPAGEPAGAPQEEAEKARVAQVSHSHSHQHTSQMGYGYSHAHPHPHASAGMQDHDTSETAHAHEHVAKAEDGTVNIDELVANQTGLQADLVALKATVESLVQALDAAKTAQSEATEALKAQVAEAAEKAKHADEKLASIEEVSRKPLTAPTNQGKAPVTKDVPFDEAFARLMA